MPQAWSQTVRRQDLLTHIREHLELCILKSGNRWFRQRHGISQGGSLSTLLCNIFLADLETRHLKPILGGKSTERSVTSGESPWPTSQPTSGTAGQMLQPSSAPTGPLSCKDSCMVRLVDDFLVISASRSKAEGVLRCLQSGIPGRKIDLNNEKTKANFRVPVVGGALEPNVYRDGASCFVPWCGLLINTESLEIQADYRRHLKGHVRSSLNVTLSKRPGECWLALLVVGLSAVLLQPVCLCSWHELWAACAGNSFNCSLSTSRDYSCP
eukprot:evm.model.scf_1408EXC.5 EVM.evm.TU.scf_1408EXC.5   scf_1408EXC:20492-22087(-)